MALIAGKAVLLCLGPAEDVWSVPSSDFEGPSTFLKGTVQSPQFMTKLLGLENRKEFFYLEGGVGTPPPNCGASLTASSCGVSSTEKQGRLGILGPTLWRVGSTCRAGNFSPHFA